MKKQIGFIGLGIMGKHMATHLLNAGYHLVVFDINRERVMALVALGAEEGISSADTASRVDIVITMVPDSPDVEEVALGLTGIIHGAKPGQIFIDMSTISPKVALRVADELGQRGVKCLDAPVSGGETGAKAASLSIMVGGDVRVFNEVKPILEVMGKTITLCGGNGAGQIVKACNQIQVALNFIGMAEAFVLGAKAGVDPSVILKVLSAGYAQTRVMDVRGPKIISGDFSPGFMSKFHLKDLNIILDTAKEFGVDLPCSKVAHELYTELIQLERGDLDHSAVITIIEDRAKVQAWTKKYTDFD